MAGPGRLALPGRAGARPTENRAGPGQGHAVVTLCVLGGAPGEQAGLAVVTCHCGASRKFEVTAAIAPSFPGLNAPSSTPRISCESRSPVSPVCRDGGWGDPQALRGPGRTTHSGQSRTLEELCCELTARLLVGMSSTPQVLTLLQQHHGLCWAFPRPALTCQRGAT